MSASAVALVVVAAFVGAFAALAIFTHQRESDRARASKRTLQRGIADRDRIESLAAADPEEQRAARNRILLRGAQGLTPLLERLRRLDDDGLEAAHQRAIEQTIADLQRVGAAAMFQVLGGLHRGHPAIPAIARIADTLGPAVLEVDGLGRISLETEALLARRLAARAGVEALATSMSNASTLVRASTAPDSVTEPAALRVLASMPSPAGRRARARWLALEPLASPFLAAERLASGAAPTEATDVALTDLFCVLDEAVRHSERARAIGWGQEKCEDEVGSIAWVRWASARVGDVRVDEELRRVATSMTPGRWMAAAVVARRGPEHAVELLRAARRSGWNEGDSEWVRLVARSAGPAGVGALLDLVMARAPVSPAELGAVLADVDTCACAAEWVARYHACYGWLAVYLESVVESFGEDDGLRAAVIGLARSDDRRVRRGAIELIGRLGWCEGVGVVVDCAGANELDEPLATVALELIGPAAAATVAPHASRSGSFRYLADLFGG